MKILQRTQPPTPRRLPPPDRSPDKGRKDEAIDFGRIGFDARSIAFALRMDRKR